MISGVFHRPTPLKRLQLPCVFLLLLMFSILNSKQLHAAHIIGFCLIAVIAAVLLLFNRSAYFYMDADHISARYHLFGRLDCAIRDVAFSDPQNQRLTLILHNGKRCDISGLNNAFAISVHINKALAAIPEREKYDTLFLRRQLLVRRKKTALILTITAFVLVFLFLFLTAALTEGKPSSDFNKNEQFLFYGFFVLLFPLFGCAFYFAHSCGRKTMQINHLEHRLRKAAAEQTPLPSDHPLQVFADTDFRRRICFYLDPVNNKLSFTREQIDDTFRFSSRHVIHGIDWPETWFGGAFHDTVNISRMFDLPQIELQEGILELVKATLAAWDPCKLRHSGQPDRSYDADAQLISLNISIFSDVWEIDEVITLVLSEKTPDADSFSEQSENAAEQIHKQLAGLLLPHP